MHSSASRKCEARVGHRLEGMLLDLVSIVRIDATDLYPLGLVGPHLMIENHVMDHAQTGVAQRGTGPLERHAISIFCGDGAFLIKFTQIENIIAVIADREATGSALPGRWQPNVGYAHVSK